MDLGSLPIPLPATPAAGSSIWVWLVFGILVIAAGVFMFIKFQRNNALEGADTGARIRSIAELEARLKAEQEDRRLEKTQMIAEITVYRDRADQFAKERNEWMMKFGDISGELRAVKAQMVEMQAKMSSMEAAFHAKTSN